MSNKTRELTLSGMFLAFGIIVPYIFHIANLGGPVFLPMHIPVLLAAFYVNPFYALSIGILAPLLNSILTGMPVFYPISIIMSFELATYGLITAIIYKKSNLLLSLIVGMISGRLVAGLVIVILQGIIGLKMNPLLYLKGALITGIPGIVIQILLVPVIVRKFKIKNI
ncbi:ECF transporter S component [Clostridiaceae bacterium HSG29]|nr:ECF transporter S component [Clostridiaceae bacterium HSG29]